MINSKKLLQLARKWRSAAAIGRKRISFRRTSSNRNPNESNEVPAVKKGHFVVYTTDGGRFSIPLSHLGNKVIIQLFAIAEEEFGFTGEGPIVLPIDASSMTHVMSLIRRGSASEQEKALSMSLSTSSRSYVVTTGQALPCTQAVLCM
ncbi:hypothetical protein MLD38_000243 [Melastoma candidum]|uniref:Uncharacterized protein n=1 Tax=Melastoma candidum TaxID=119954 RepID=A0ACB9S9W7_9MYRT|nr:hypothetical protein MLD38_000243 [Melastoma candidum]